ncbi:N-acetylglucosamine-1-phosphodiester alpha-N-acetylglucosaminidase-like [Antedon mediterranea]|uniref:N-acetylglucosamine-1-phosphodiester alpha-N-acetylglucosaminidase-like n=1 Tax=Antedon mediterranea TaxID=105859 RepID=UPI003AF8EC48
MDSRFVVLYIFCCYVRCTDDIGVVQTINYVGRTLPSSNQTMPQCSKKKSTSSYILLPSHGMTSNITHPITKTRYFTKDFSNNGTRTCYGRVAFVNNPLHTLSVLEPLEQDGCKNRKRATVVESSKQKSCFVAVNGGFYVPETNECLGNIVSDGRLVKMTPGLRNVHFGIRQDGSLLFGYLSTEEIENTRNPFVQLISGIGWLLRNGTVYLEESKRIECDSEWSAKEIFGSKSGRTVIGSDVDGRVVIVQVDGKTHVSGVTLKEMANFLIELGLVNAINIDGGGSSTCVINGTVVNNPPDKCSDQQYNCIRPVSTIICAHAPRSLPSQCSHDSDHYIRDVRHCQGNNVWKP